MGAASANVPAIVLNSGPGTPRSATGGPLATANGVWRFVDQLRAGSVSIKAFEDFERGVMGTPGHCSEMGTASTMSVLSEALGMALPGSSLVPSSDGRRIQYAKEVGRRAVAMTAIERMSPSSILSAQAFDNAITLLCAVGARPMPSSTFWRLRGGWACRCPSAVSMKSPARCRSSPTSSLRGNT